MDYLIAVIVGYVVGYWFRGIMVIYHLSRNPESMIEILKQVKAINDREAQGLPETESKPGQGVELAIERVNNYLYAYTKDTNQFIAQGPDLKSLLEDAHKRFPGKIFFGDIPADSPAKELV